MYKRMTVLHSQNEAQGSRLEEMEAELAHVHQELDDLQSQCEDKDAQVRKILSPPLYPGSFSNNFIMQSKRIVSSTKQIALQKWCLEKTKFTAVLIIVGGFSLLRAFC